MADRATPPTVTLSTNKMQAYVTIAPPAFDEQPYTLDEIKYALLDAKVIYGIDETVIKNMLLAGNYSNPVCVANGKPFIEGKDAYYEYLFDMNTDSRPEELEDGSVDYWSVNLINIVSKGDVVVKYHGAEQGVDGIDVCGKTIIAKRKKELTPLKGRGFIRDDETGIYTSEVNGKIDFFKDRIIISPIYEIKGDADLKTGNINFPGDVVVHGNVISGVTIKAEESVTVDGVVEHANIIAGKDVVIRTGVKGLGRTNIKAKGSITAKYIEFANIDAGMNVEADSIVDCNVSAGDMIILNGKHGRIIGGNVSAISGIETKELGNSSEANTMVQVGVKIEIIQRLEALRKKMTITQKNIEKIAKGIEEFDRLIATNSALKKDDPRRMQLLKVKIRDTALLAADKAEFDNLNSVIAKGSGASVYVLDKVFPGVEVAIGQYRVRVKEYQQSVEFVRESDRVKMRSLSG